MNAVLLDDRVAGMLSTSKREMRSRSRSVFIGYGELAYALRDAFVEFLGDSPLFAQEARLSQPDGRLVRGDIQTESLRLYREVTPLGSGDDAADLTVESQMRGRNRQIEVVDEHPCVRRPLQWRVAQRRVDRLSDLSLTG